MDTEKDLNKQESPQRLLNYIDVINLKRILDAFTTTTGLMANIVDKHGCSIFSKKDVKRCCKFCKIIFAQEGGLARCQRAYERAGKQAALFQKPYIFRCPSGLMEFAAPITVNGEHVGTIICGQVLMWEPEDFFWVELREMNKDLDVDFRELFQSVEELPVLSGPQVQAAAYLLYVVANYIMNAGWENYRQAKEVEISQSMLHEEIKTRQTLEKQLVNDMSVIRENELINIFLGSETDMAQYFQRMIASIRYDSFNNIRTLRTKLIFLMNSVLRVCVKLGINSDEHADFIDRSYKNLFDSDKEENVVLVIDSFINYLFRELKNKRDIPANANIRSMIEFMEENYQKQITLEMIAQSADLSASYASRLFKKSTGMSITDYLIQVRMENAKRHLLNPHYQIERIAENVGFSDSSYFTKVFRKYEGITPTNYRKNNK